jgi:beta-glucanase (GH16 family)
VRVVARALLLLGVTLIAATGPDRSQATHATGYERTAANAYSPSGEPLPVGDMPGWHQVFSDDFTTDVPLGRFPGAVSDKWTAYQEGWTDTSGNGTYYPSKVISIHNGVLNMYLHTEHGIHMVAAPEPKIPGAVGSEGGLLYGRYAVRFRADRVHGYKTAWLLWPDSEKWPADGEIDFPEANLDGTVSAFMHHQNGTSQSDQDAFGTLISPASWHTAVTEWTSKNVTFILDGQTIASLTTSIPNTPMHWVLQTETVVGGRAPNDSAAGNVQIDWVAVYVPANTPAVAPPQPTAHSSSPASATPTAVPAVPSVPTAPAKANVSMVSTIESIAVKAGIPALVVMLLCAVFVYTIHSRRKVGVHRHDSSRRPPPPQQRYHQWKDY